MGSPAWSQCPAQGQCSAGAHAPGEVSALCQAGHWSGQVPGPACARPNSGARLPCQGTPASGARRTVPVPWTWKSLTFRAAGAGLLGPVQLMSGGQGFGLTQQNSPGLEQSWQTAWDLWKGLDSAQSWRLAFWTWLVGRWAGTLGPRRGLCSFRLEGALGRGVSAVGLGSKPTCTTAVCGATAPGRREGRARGRGAVLGVYLRAARRGRRPDGCRNSCVPLSALPAVHSS